MESERNFMGMPIEGGPSRTHVRTKDELAELFAAVLADPAVEAIRWNQYTPYFNDGDVCEFGANGVEFRIAGTPDDLGEQDDGFVDYCHVAIKGGAETEYKRVDSPRGAYGGWLGSSRYDYVKVETGRNFDRVASADAIEKLTHAIDGGEFDHVLDELFGDPANVLVSRDGIAVETYEHD